MSTLFRGAVNLLQKASPRSLFLVVYGSFACIKNTYNLLIRYGLLKSSYLWKSIERNGTPIPWFSYPAVEYLEGLDLSEYSVFEYGSGYSTLYWGRRAKRVTSVEDHAEWRDRIQTQLGDNATIRLVCSPDDYPGAIKDSDQEFNIIVIDGASNISRLECARAAIPKLRTGGIIILDDADDFPDVPNALREAGLLQVDFAGFNPINTYTKTTSFFFHRQFNPKPRGRTLPMHSVCHPLRSQNSHNVVEPVR